MRDEDTLLKEQELKNMQLLVNRLEEEKRALIKGVDEEVSNAKRKIYEKVQAQFNAGNEEFSKVKSENEEITKELIAIKKAA